jgi:hypothetical protein
VRVPPLYGRMTMRPLIVASFASLALAACGGSDENANMPTTEESQGLNEAAEMLDTSPDSLVAVDEGTLGNGEAAADANEANEEPRNEVNAD